MNENQTLVQLVKDSGLEKTKQNQIAETLGTFFNKASEWNNTIQSIVITRPDEIGKMKMAKEGRLSLKRMRLQASEAVRSQRDEVKYRMANDVLEDKLWLKAGQMIEATFKNLEVKLEEKERFAEIWEANIRDELNVKRVDELKPYAEFVIPGIDLGRLSDEQYSKLLSGAKLQLQTEQKAIKDRIEKEKAEEKERERIRLENEKLKVEAEKREKAFEAQKVKAQAERWEIEDKARKEREVVEAKLEAQQIEFEKAADELEAKEAVEKKAKELAEKKAEAAPDKVKLREFAKVIYNLPLPEMKTDEGKGILKYAKDELEKIACIIGDKVQNI